MFLLGWAWAFRHLDMYPMYHLYNINMGAAHLIITDTSQEPHLAGLSAGVSPSES